jgi:hypothetical protein
MPWTPKHDGIRQFVSVYPLLAMLSWIGMQGVLAHLRKEKPGWNHCLVEKASAAVVVGILAVVLLSCHPFMLSYYNLFIGGIEGAEMAGMEMTMHFETISARMLAVMKEHLTPGTTLAMFPRWELLLKTYQKHGLLGEGFTVLPAKSTARPDYILVVRRRFTFDERLYKAMVPLCEVKYRSVSLVKFVRIPEQSEHGRPAP